MARRRTFQELRVRGQIIADGVMQQEGVARASYRECIERVTWIYPEPHITVETFANHWGALDWEKVNDYVWQAYFDVLPGHAHFALDTPPPFIDNGGTLVFPLLDLSVDAGRPANVLALSFSNSSGTPIIPENFSFIVRFKAYK